MLIMREKRQLLLLTIFLCISVLSVQAQRFVGFASAGANFAQIEGDDVHGFTKVGANGGAGVLVYLNEKQTWSVSAELLYAQKGAYKRAYFDTTNYAASMFQDVDYDVPFKDYAKCNISLDYVQIPVLFHYDDLLTGCKIGLGFSWSRLVRAKEIYNGYTRTISARSNTYKKSDWNVMADVDIRLYKNLSLNLRYEYSLVPVRELEYVYVKNGGYEEPEWHKYFNHVVTLRLTYYFNQKYVKNTKTNRQGERVGTKWIREITDYER